MKRSNKKSKNLAQLIELIENGTWERGQSRSVVAALRDIQHGMAVRDPKQVEKSINRLARLLLRVEH
jgi:CTP:molybdopterin cytidylyltransferase MocA